MNTEQQKRGGEKELAARLMAVQACYQMSQNAETNNRQITKEYLDHRDTVSLDGEDLQKADKALFKNIMDGLEERIIEIDELLYAHISGNQTVPQSTEVPKTLEDLSQYGNNFVPTEMTRQTEPLLRSILLCGICEILMHPNIDHPLIINDYLDIAHAFYEKQQVSLVNGVLDSIAKLLRSGDAA